MVSVKSLYIHIPFCISKCAYCDFFSVTGFSKEGMDLYAKALSREIDFYLKYYNPGILESVYIGGGTPSLLSLSALKTIFKAFSKNIDENTEITMEMNASDVTEESLLNAENLGVNRLSVGLQAFSDSALKLSNRRGDREDNLRALSALKSVWKKNLSCDLIAALPMQSKDELFEGISLLTENNISHISLYSLTIEEGTPLYRMLEDGKIKYNFEKADKMWIQARDFLLEKGYDQYEVSNFCKNDSFMCRHNLAYWNQKSYLGAGSGASGSIYDFEKQRLSFRYTNTKKISDYVNFWLSFDGEITEKSLDFPLWQKEELSKETLIFEFFMMGLRKSRGVNLSDFEKRFSISISEKIKKVMDFWVSQKKAIFYQENGTAHFSMTKEGLLFLNQFLEEII